MKRFVFVAVLVVCAMTLLSLAPAQDVRSLTAAALGGAASFASEAREVNMDFIPQATPSEITPHMKMLRPRDGRTDAQYAEMKRQAAQLAGSGNGGYGMLRNAAPAPDGGSTFLHSTHSFRAQSEVCCTPSDMAIAVGPTYVVQFVNTYVAIYTKTGVLQSGYPKSADTFFGLPAGTYTTDPRGFYDWKNGRYVFVMLTESSFSSNNVGQLMLAVSTSSNPIANPTWHIFKWQVGATGECPDYPTLGHDTNSWGTNGTKGAIYIGINQFANNCNGGFIQNYMFVIPKDKPYAGTGMPYWYQYGLTVGGTLVDTLQPSNPVSQGDRPSATYLTNSFNILFNCGGGCSGLTMWSVNNSAAFTTGGPGPTFAGVVLPTTHTYYYPPNANQPGHAQSIETIDARITGSMYYHAGDLWGSFETGVSGVSGAHQIWFDYHPILDTNGNITGGDERQEDCFVCGGFGTNGSSYFATLIPDTENNVTMTYTFSDDNIYPEYVITGRRVSYGDSLMNGVGHYLAGGSGYYSQFRWGDYSAVAPDNTTASSPLMWTAGDFDNGGNWGTVISSQSYTGPKDQ
jgi:hypothetical protein